MGYKLVKGATIGAVSALGLAAAMNATAVEFEAGDTTVDLYGFARFAAAYDFDEDLASGGQSGQFNALNTSDDDVAEGHFGADAQTSRLGVRVNTPDDVTINLEGDWDGSNGNFRLRQAWGEWNNVLAGQTWSNFNSFVGGTSTVDFDSNPGSAGLQGRVAQLRYTVGNFSVSAEDPSASVVGPVNDDGDFGLGFDELGAAPTKTQFPALTARYEASAGPVSYSFAGIVREVEFDTGTEDDSATGVGAFAAATFDVTNAVSIQGAVNYSDGTNAYLYRSGSNFAGADAYVDPDGNLETIEGYGGTLGVSIAAGPGTINAVYGIAELDLDDAEEDWPNRTASLQETNEAIFVNYLWNPTDAITYGVEYGRYETELVNGDDGDADRVMFLAQYSF